MTRLLGFLALVVAGVGLVPAPASAAYCSSSGVHVLVQFGALGGGEQKGCLPTDSRVTGDRAFNGAGFPLAFVPSQPGAVCRVKGKPGPSACAEMPPANAYWAVFEAHGGGWSYSNTGVGGVRLNPGDSVAFVWQGSGARTNPGAAPGRSTFPAPKPSKPTQPPKPPKADKPAKPKPAKGPQGSSPKSSPGATASASPTAGPSASATASGRPSATPSSTASGSPSGDSTAAAAPPESLTPRGEPAEEGLPGWVPIGLVVGLSGAAAAAVAIRRRWA